MLLEGLAILDGMEEAKLVSLPFRPYDLTISDDLQNNCQAIWNFICEAHNKCQAQNARDRYESNRARIRASFGTGFVYEFSQGDLDRLQAVIQETRKLITESDLFTEEHRRRLLLKLEKLQSEVHKKVSSLDHFWGVVLEAGVVAKKLGEDAKPIVDRIREIGGIVWRTQARAEDLPSDSPPPLADNKTSAIGSDAD
jgi:hypothetical protein